MSWGTALLLALFVGLSLWASRWLRLRPGLMPARVLLLLALGTLALAFAVGAVWAEVPWLRGGVEGLFLGAWTLNLLNLLNEVPSVRALPRGRRWGLSTLTAAFPLLSLTLALAVLSPGSWSEWAAGAQVWALLALLGVWGVLAGTGRWVRGRWGGWILHGPGEAPPSRR